MLKELINNYALCTYLVALGNIPLAAELSDYEKFAEFINSGLLDCYTTEGTHNEYIKDLIYFSMLAKATCVASRCAYLC